MRDNTHWRKKLTKKLRQGWTTTLMEPSELCDIELGLTLLACLMPEAPAQTLWVLLSGYPYPALDIRYRWTRDQWGMLSTARHLLPYYRHPYPWQRALEEYQQVEEHLRG